MMNVLCKIRQIRVPQSFQPPRSRHVVRHSFPVSPNDTITPYRRGLAEAETMLFLEILILFDLCFSYSFERMNFHYLTRFSRKTIKMFSILICRQCYRWNRINAPFILCRPPRPPKPVTCTSLRSRKSPTHMALVKILHSRESLRLFLPYNDLVHLPVRMEGLSEKHIQLCMVGETTGYLVSDSFVVVTDTCTFQFVLASNLESRRSRFVGKHSVIKVVIETCHQNWSIFLWRGRNLDKSKQWKLFSQPQFICVGFQWVYDVTRGSIVK